MGYDSNIKSIRAERRLRLTLIFAVLALVSACVIIVKVLGSNSKSVASNNAEKRGNNERLARAQALAEIKKAAAIEDRKASAAVGNLRAASKGGGGESDGSENGDLRAEQEKLAAQKVADLDAEVRAIKKTGVIMEADKHSLQMTGKLQSATRELIKLRYGDFGTKPYRVRLDLEFQPTIPDFEEKGKDGTLTIELAPISLIPCSVYNFLEIARTWKSGAFHRNAGHVLQAQTRSDVTQSMPFQEFSEEYPHKLGTVGYAGRPSGPEFYVSIQDNTQAHGRGSQQNHNPYEADCIIGRVINGGMDSVVPRIHKMPGTEFLGDRNKWVLIRRMHILVPGEGPDGYVEFSKSPLVIPQ